MDIKMDEINTDTTVIGIMFCGPQDNFWRIEMPCGHKVSYPLNGLPEKDTPCPCGNPKHWLVKFDDREPPKEEA